MIERFRLWYAAQPRGLRALLTINVVAYLLWQVVFIHIGPVRQLVWDHLALNPGLPGVLFEPWQLLSYAFLHLQPGLGGLLHIGFNMLWLWWVGRDLEDLQGPHRVVAVYVLGAVGGALLTIFLNGVLPGSSLFSGVVHGASGAVLAVMAAVGVAYPFKRIGLFLIGSVKILHIVIALLALDVLFLAAGGTSVSAHFGGALAGAAVARLQQVGTDVTGWARVFFGKTGRRSRAQVGTLERMESWLSRRERRAPDIRPMSAPAADAEEDGETEVDRILDKISEKGYDALSPSEKRILYEASKNG